MGRARGERSSVIGGIFYASWPRRKRSIRWADAGAELADIAYSILGTCRLLDINPTDYLGDVLPVLARGVSIQRDVPNLTPQAWMRARIART